jgi:CspA family cold shock protein
MEQTVSERQKGIVLNFGKKNKDFGFIRTANRDLFVHYSEILSDDEYKSLAEGQIVEFEEVETVKGWAAKNVKVIR